MTDDVAYQHIERLTALLKAEQTRAEKAEVQVTALAEALSEALAWIQTRLALFLPSDSKVLEGQRRPSYVVEVLIDFIRAALTPELATQAERHRLKEAVIKAAREDENRGPELQAALAALWVAEQEAEVKL